MKPFLTCSLLIVILCSASLVAAAEPLKIFILAGQSNMEGHAKVETFDYLGDDPATAPLLKEMCGPDGEPQICKKVWISYLTGNDVAKQGKLTAGYGALGGELKIGPEFTFGITIDKAYRGPILIIKTAWGGKSLHTDFRSPSAGPYTLNPFQIEHYSKQQGHGIPKDFEQWKADKIKETGHYYRRMIEHVQSVLKDLAKVCPEYDPAIGHELAGFVWLQGWNDLVDVHTYPKGHEPGGYELYSTLLAHFIRDVRKDLAAPKLPFVIGVMGVSGLKPDVKMVNFRSAMAAPAALPEFQGNVVAVQTAPFWDERLGAIDEKRGRIRQMGFLLKSMNKNAANADGKMTDQEQRAYLKEYEAKLISPEEVALWQRGASNAGYHYLGCAKTFALMGDAFAKAILPIQANSNPR